MKTNYATLSKPGQRLSNEDYVSPGKDLHAPNLFMVCDGVGGAVKGEVASELVCKTITTYFNEHATEKITEQAIEEAVLLSTKKIARHIGNHPEDKGLSTTLALVYIQQESALVAHAGDSRVYHIRNGKILFKTQDHSYVNELVSAGLITSEKARSHSKRNVITKAISDDKDSADVDIHQISELQKEDYFLICSDGVLEGLDETFIESNFQSTEISKLLATIDNICAEKSKDNYSAIIIQLV